MKEIVERKKCTGCKVCGDVCPVEAIKFDYDKDGFWYPTIEKEKCIDCGKCRQVCPSVKYQYEENKKQTVYQAWSKNSKQRINSTSGGLFWEIASCFLKENGVVVGCEYDEDWKSAKHVLARNFEELERLRGSKYFQSDTRSIYKTVRAEVYSGTKVLFCGTPCQIAAMRNYMGREYDNLYYMDFICRSINSPLAFAEYISEQEKRHNSKVTCVRLKDKTYGWQSLATYLRFENGEESLLDKTNDPWVRGFIFSDLYTRESCFNCQYRELPRKTADITIGDFWGISGETVYDNYAGISVVLVNNEKGQMLFNQIKSSLFIKERTIDEAVKGNPALLKSPTRPKREYEFFEELKKREFSEIAMEAANPTARQKLRWKMRDFSAEIRRIKKFIKQGRVSLPKYIYWNYLTQNVIRMGKAKIIPNKNAIMDIDKSAKIILRGDQDVIIGYNKLRKSKSETHIRMEKNSCWNCNHGANIFYNTVIELKPNATLDTGFFTMNGGSVIIADKHIKLGEDVMIGRNVVIYDSDFHQIFDENGEVINKPQKVTIEDHVWLTSNISVLKGVTIGEGSLVMAQTVVNRDMPEKAIIGANATGKVKKDEVYWSRKRCN